MYCEILQGNPTLYLYSVVERELMGEFFFNNLRPAEKRDVTTDYASLTAPEKNISTQNNGIIQMVETEIEAPVDGFITNSQQSTQTTPTDLETIK